MCFVAGHVAYFQVGYFLHIGYAHRWQTCRAGAQERDFVGSKRWSRFHDKSSWQTLRCGTVGRHCGNTNCRRKLLHVSGHVLACFMFVSNLFGLRGRPVRDALRVSTPACRLLLVFACLSLAQIFHVLLPGKPLPSALQRTPKVRLAPLSNGQRGTDGLSDPSRVI